MKAGSKPLSKPMFALLNYVEQYRVKIEHLRWANATTLWACGYRGYLAINGAGEDAAVDLTNEGKRVVLEYRNCSDNPYLPSRLAEAELTARCQAVLGLGRLLSVAEKRNPKKVG